MTRIISKTEVLDKLREKIPTLLGEKAIKETRLKAVCQLMLSLASHYNWVGLYLVDRDDPELLVLGPYAGEPTEHVRIPFGKGVCGATAVSRTTTIVADVAAHHNYLACSLEVKSEIVVPIEQEGRLLGLLDIDSHFSDAFDEEDVAFLEPLASQLAALL